jgi:uncharacterized protein DUF2332
MPYFDQLAGVYTRFADHEARGRSALYEELARGIAGDREILCALAELPRPKQQPNLILAAVRHLCGVADGWPQFHRWFLERRNDVVAVMLARRTQTNEPARCAALLPLLALLPQPLALRGCDRPIRGHRTLPADTRRAAGRLDRPARDEHRLAELERTDQSFSRRRA